MALTTFVFAAGNPIDTEESELALVLLIFFVLLALVVSFLCSIAEAVLLSITPAFIEGMKKTRPRRAELLKKLRQDHIDRSLSAILTMNTIAHTIGAIEAGAQASVLFGSHAVGLFSVVITLLILFFSEIIPKTIGAVYWEKLTGLTARYIQVLIIVLYPLVRIAEFITSLTARGKKIHKFSREEFIAMAWVGEKTGDIEKRESRIIQNLLRLRSIKITDIMTPRTVISALHKDLSVEEAQHRVANSPFSRFPLYGKGTDNIEGFVLKPEILKYESDKAREMTLEPLKRDIMVVSETMSLPDLLEFLLNHREHIVMIVDEFGGTKGLVTLEDVIETLLGMEIVDELDNVEDMRALARQQWSKRMEAHRQSTEKPKEKMPSSDPEN